MSARLVSTVLACCAMIAAMATSATAATPSPIEVKRLCAIGGETAERAAKSGREARGNCAFASRRAPKRSKRGKRGDRRRSPKGSTRPVPAPQPAPAPAPAPQPEPEPEPAPQPAPEPDPQPEPAPQPDPAPEPEPEPDPTPQPQPEPIPQPVPEPEPEPVPPAPEPQPQPSSRLVVGIDGGHDEWWSDTIWHRTQLGAAVTRHEWDPSEAIDVRDGTVYAAASRVGTRIHALLGGNDLGDPTHYRAWVLAFVARYGPGGEFWAEHPELDEERYAITSVELGNEPYFGEMSPTEYAATVKPTLLALAADNPGVKVILPTYIHGARTTWIDTLYGKIPGLNDLYYALADHPYWYGHHPSAKGDNGPFDRIDTLRERMAHHGAADKPIYITEYGESTAKCGSECVTEAVQAEHLQAMLEAIVERSEWKVEMISLFQLHDWATDSTNRERQFGLLRHNATKKPSYALVREAMQRHRG
jgi:hypothetical protein